MRRQQHLILMWHRKLTYRTRWSMLYTYIAIVGALETHVNISVHVVHAHFFCVNNRIASIQLKLFCPGRQNTSH